MDAKHFSVISALKITVMTGYYLAMYPSPSREEGAVITYLSGQLQSIWPRHKQTESPC